MVFRSSSNSNYGTATKTVVDPAKKFNFETELGSGAFATVYKVTDRVTHKVSAIKKLLPDATGALPIQEYELAKSLKHVNIVRTLDCFVFENVMFLQLELMNGGDLFTKLDPSGNGIDESIAAKYMKQLAEGVGHLHSVGIVHCDIKPENVLLHNNVIKICDLGLAGKAGSERTGASTGTGAYMAPELINRRSSTPYTIETANDVWSLGIVLYAVLFADLPWEKAKPRDKDFHLFCRKGGVSAKLHPFHFTSPKMRTFLSRLLHIVPKNRPTMAEVATFFDDSKTPWFVAARQSLDISYGLKEAPAAPAPVQPQWDTESVGSSRSSVSSLPEMMTDLFVSEQPLPVVDKRSPQKTRGSIDRTSEMIAAAIRLC